MAKLIPFLLLFAFHGYAFADNLDDPVNQSAPATTGYGSSSSDHPGHHSPANAVSGDTMPVGSAESSTAGVDQSDDDEDFLDDSDDVTVEVWDPLEPINRGMFWFNDKLYFWLFKPVARAYRVVPEPARESVQNFFFNIDTPVRFINSALQLKFQDAGNELVRFVVNSTIGVLGLFDPAKNHLGIERKDEDTGQTFGRYGIGPGFYLVLPGLGPSNLRDGIGRIGDTYLDPIWHLVERPEYYGVKFLDIETDLSLDKDTYESIKQDNLDPYLFVRDAYMQLRAGKVRK